MNYKVCIVDQKTKTIILKPSDNSDDTQTGELPPPWNGGQGRKYYADETGNLIEEEI